MKTHKIGLRLLFNNYISYCRLKLLVLFVGSFYFYFDVWLLPGQSRRSNIPAAILPLPEKTARAVSRNPEADKVGNQREARLRVKMKKLLRKFWPPSDRW